MVVFASAAKPPTTTTREAEEKNEKNAWHVSISVLGGGRNSRGKKEKEEEEDVEARNGGFSRVRHESTLKAVLALARRVDYEIDPDDEYPSNYTGRISATLTDGTTLEAFQPHLRGGSKLQLGRDELVRKCAANIEYGGVTQQFTDKLVSFADALHTSEEPISLPG